MAEDKEIIYLASNRFFWFDLRWFFPEYADTSLPAAKYPYHKERHLRHLNVITFLGESPTWHRLNILLWVIEIRETELKIGNAILGTIEEESKAILEEAESQV
ncbi:MAG: hypothetical protein K9L57_12360 [Spirochaetaceae bacterium]|nr:hypothetical protein [Spirochaetaceae bacterium]